MASGFIPKCPGCGGKMQYLCNEVYCCDPCEITLDIEASGITIPRETGTQVWRDPRKSK
jgi:tRNA(Ile2) C34 agmatinyltransferase TiaS